MKKTDNNLQKFIEKITEIQTSIEKKGLSEQELKEIALEMGMTEKEWQEVEKTFHDHITRGKGFLKYENFDDALYEFQQACTINPDHVDLLYYLALTYKSRWIKKYANEDRNKAEEYAKRCIHFDPSHQGALKLISSLKRKQKPGKKAGMFIIAGICLLLVAFFVIGLIVFINIPINMKESNQPFISTSLTLNEILVPYIISINRHSQRIYQSYNRYLSWIDNPETGPTGKDGTVYGLYDIYDSKEHLENIENMNKHAKDYPDLGIKGKEYCTAFTNLKPLLAQALDYYETDNYLDDDFEKGKELHAPLIFAFKNYIFADRALKNHIKELQVDVWEKVTESLSGFNKSSKEYQMLYLADAAYSIMLKALAVDMDLNNREVFLTATGLYDEILNEFSYLAELNEKEWSLSWTYSKYYNDFEKTLTLYRRAADKGNTREKYRTNTIYKQLVDDFNRTVNTCNLEIIRRFPPQLKYLWFKIPPELIYPID